MKKFNKIMVKAVTLFTAGALFLTCGGIKALAEDTQHDYRESPAIVEGAEIPVVFSIDKELVENVDNTTTNNGDSTTINYNTYDGKPLDRYIQIHDDSEGKKTGDSNRYYTNVLGTSFLSVVQSKTSNKESINVNESVEKDSNIVEVILKDVLSDSAYTKIENLAKAYIGAYVKDIDYTKNDYYLDWYVIKHQQDPGKGFTYGRVHVDGRIKVVPKDEWTVEYRVNGEVIETAYQSYFVSKDEELALEEINITPVAQLVEVKEDDRFNRTETKIAADKKWVIEYSSVYTVNFYVIDVNGNKSLQDSQEVEYDKDVENIPEITFPKETVEDGVKTTYSSTQWNKTAEQLKNVKENIDVERTITKIEEDINDEWTVEYIVNGKIIEKAYQNIEVLKGEDLPLEKINITPVAQLVEVKEDDEFNRTETKYANDRTWVIEYTSVYTVNFYVIDVNGNKSLQDRQKVEYDKDLAAEKIPAVTVPGKEVKDGMIITYSSTQWNKTAEQLKNVKENIDVERTITKTEEKQEEKEEPVVEKEEEKQEEEEEPVVEKEEEKQEEEEEPVVEKEEEKQEEKKEEPAVPGTPIVYYVPSTEPAPTTIPEVPETNEEPEEIDVEIPELPEGTPDEDEDEIEVAQEVPEDEEEPEEDTFELDVPSETPQGAPEDEEPDEIEVELPDVPEGLPQTGTTDVIVFYGIGLACVGLGAFTVKKGLRKEEDAE